jgi:hypothetical protein
MSLLRLCLFVLIVLGAALPASAKDETAQKSLGSFGKWRAYTFDENDQTVCYMALSVAAPATGKIKRGPKRLIITHRPAEGSKDVISYAPGYTFKPDSVLTIRIGAKSFDLFTTKDTAWARDAGTDRALAASIRVAKSMAATGTPALRGAKPVTDTLQLDGAAKAYQAIGKACGLEVEEKKAVSGKKKVKKPPVKH